MDEIEQYNKAVLELRWAEVGLKSYVMSLLKKCNRNVDKIMDLAETIPPSRTRRFLYQCALEYDIEGETK